MSTPKVITAEAVARLFGLYRTELRGELREVVRTAHVALADACDTGASVITDRHIESGFAAWE